MNAAVPAPEGNKQGDEVPKANPKKINHVKHQNPAQQEVIEISSDSEKNVKKKQQPPENIKKDGEGGASRKKGPTLTSVLTARSKVLNKIVNLLSVFG